MPDSNSTWTGFLSGRYGIFLLFMLATGIRFAGIGEKQLWVDEIIQVIHSSPDSIGDILRGVAQDRGGAPLDYVVQHYVMKASRPELPLEASARLHAAIFGSVSVVLIYVSCMLLLGNRRTAAWSAALYAFFPFHHHYSQEGRPYALFVLLILVLFILHLKAQRSGSWAALFAMALCGILAYYTQPFTALFFLVLMTVNFFQLKAGRVKVASPGFLAPFISGIAGACLFAPWIAYSVEKTRGEFAHPVSWRLIAEAVQGLGDGSYPVSIAILLLAMLGAVHLKRKHSEALTCLGCWILVPIPLLLIILHLRSYFFSPRQLIFVTPALVMLAACGVDRLLSRYGKKALVVPAFYLAASLVVIILHYPDRGIDFRGAGGYLRREVRTGDRIVAPDTIGLLSFYFPEIYGYGNNGLECGPGCRRLIFVDTEYGGEAALKTVEARMVLKKRADFRRISILIFGNETADAHGPPRRQFATAMQTRGSKL